MKIIKTLSFVAVLSFLFYGCPSDTEPTSPATTYYDYLPLANDNYWNYTNTVESTSAISADSLYIIGNVTVNSNSYFDFEANADATGIYTLFMKDINIRKDNHNYLANGVFTINLGSSPINIAINDEVMLTDGASAGMQLSSINDTQTQTINGIPLTFYTTLKTEVVTTNANQVIDGISYENTITTRTTLSMKIDAAISGFTVTAMTQQDVMVMDNVYADQKGMVLSEVNIEYHLEDFSSYGIDLGIPLDYQESSTQVIVNYNLN